MLIFFQKVLIAGDGGLQIAGLLRATRFRETGFLLKGGFDPFRFGVLRERLFATYGVFPDSTADVREDRAR